MSYYGPNFAGIETGWYRKTSEENYATGRGIIDKHWNTICDEILIKYVGKYGTFFSAFEEDIIKEIDMALGTSFDRKMRSIMNII